MNTRNLEGHVAVISGGLGDIGRAIAMELAGRGAHVVIGDLHPPDRAVDVLRAIEALGARARYDRVDVADAGAVSAWVAEVEADLGTADLIVPNAAIVTGADVLTMTPEEWDRELRVNLSGAFHLAQAGARRLVERGVPGRIVFVGSWAAHAPHPQIPAYSVAKAGLRMLCRCMALDLARHGILVNEVAPGYVDAGLSGRMFAANPELREKCESLVPTGRMMAAEDVARQVAHLCDPGNAHMTGSVVLMDGGLSLASPAWRPEERREAQRRTTAATAATPEPAEPRVSSLQALTTEQRNPHTTEMDRLSIPELAALLHRENAEPARAVERALPEIARAIEVIADRLSKGGRLFYVGAGTSGRLGVLDASECPPTFGVDSGMVQGIVAGGDTALTQAIEGAEDDAALGATDLVGRGVGPGDVVVGIAASGRTPYAIGALDASRRAGAYAIALVNVRQAEMAAHADLTISAVTGPEALAGSTRLKAGSAQKMVLNLLTTAAMVRLGKTYGNLMVDVRATNEKLRQRAVRIVRQATGASEETARVALEESGWHAKTAIVMVALGVSAQQAAARLERAGGFTRQALEE